MDVYSIMLEIASGTPAAACHFANGIQPDDLRKVNQFASTIGGWGIVAARFPQLLAGAKADEEKGKMTPQLATTLIGLAALCRAKGHALRI